MYTNILNVHICILFSHRAATRDFLPRHYHIVDEAGTHHGINEAASTVFLMKSGNNQERDRERVLSIFEINNKIKIKKAAFLPLFFLCIVILLCCFILSLICFPKSLLHLSNNQPINQTK
jgi:hypothetical protein